MINNKKAFTFVELIITTIIIVILTATWFYSYVWYLTDARDSQRNADMSKVKSAMKLHKTQKWSYPNPWSAYNITNSWVIVAMQWFLNDEVWISTLDTLLNDPQTLTPYVYSVSASNLEFQVGMSLENWEYPVALLDWDYKSVARNILPNIILAKTQTWWTSVEIHSWVTNAWWIWTTNRNLFIFNKIESLPYSFTDPYDPYYDWVILDNKLTYDNLWYWQNSDFMNCSEIYDAWKSISIWYAEKYDVRNWSWVLSIWWVFCTCTSTWCL
jgi:type II secretory pathway pseudopilin PulG